MALVRSVARKLPDFPAVGRDGLENVALLALHRSRYRNPNKALMHRIAYSAMVDELRRMKLSARSGRFQPEFTPFDVENEEGGVLEHPEVEPVYEEDPTDAMAILEILTEKQRRLVMRVLQGYTSREIGEEFGVSESRISQLMGAVRTRLVADAARTRSAEAVFRRVQS